MRPKNQLKKINTHPDLRELRLQQEELIKQARARTDKEKTWFRVHGKPQPFRRIAKRSAKRIRGVNQKSRQIETNGYTDFGNKNTRNIHAYRPNYKGTIERFFGQINLQTKAPEQSSTAVMKMSDLMALLEDARRQIDDQRTEHKMTPRARNSRGRKRGGRRHSKR